MWYKSTSNRSRTNTRRSAISRASLQTLENRQLLSVSPAMNYAVGDMPQAVVTADFNNDGRLDVATANYYSGTVSTLLNNGAGTFQSAKTTAAGTMPKFLAAGDFNRDGRQDLATSGASGIGILL